MGKALLVIDMLKDFLCPTGRLYCGDKARGIVPFVRQKIEDFHKSGDLVIFLCDSHRKDDREFELFPPHCVEGTAGAEIIDELPVGKKDLVVKKGRYSGFYGTDLDAILKRNRISEVEVVGVCTSICVMDTVGGLRNRDYRVRVYSSGVADFDPQSHDFSLKRMEKIYGAQIG